MEFIHAKCGAWRHTEKGTDICAKSKGHDDPKNSPTFRKHYDPSTESRWT